MAPLLPPQTPLVVLTNSGTASAAEIVSGDTLSLLNCYFFKGVLVKLFFFSRVFVGNISASAEPCDELLRSCSVLHSKAQYQIDSRPVLHFHMD
jgi:hypothetical protein